MITTLNELRPHVAAINALLARDEENFAHQRTGNPRLDSNRLDG